MTGKELARAIRNTRGPILVQMLVPQDVALVQAIKADLIDWATQLGDEETGMRLGKCDNGWILEMCH